MLWSFFLLILTTLAPTVFISNSTIAAESQKVPSLQEISFSAIEYSPDLETLEFNIFDSILENTSSNKYELLWKEQTIISANNRTEPDYLKYFSSRTTMKLNDFFKKKELN